MKHLMVKVKSQWNLLGTLRMELLSIPKPEMT